jgi:energy-converting hydrogenase Eha subunit H
VGAQHTAIVHGLMEYRVMATRSFFAVTLVATLVGIGLAEIVQRPSHMQISDVRSSPIGLCMTQGIACGATRAGFSAF